MVVGLWGAGWSLFDFVRALHRGRTPRRGLYGSVRRVGRPALFRRYVIGDVIAFLFCLGVAIWGMTHLNYQRFSLAHTRVRTAGHGRST